jgi:hypothetical protein
VNPEFGYLVTALTDSTVIYGYGDTAEAAVEMARKQLAGAGRYRPQTKRSQVTRTEYLIAMTAFRERQSRWARRRREYVA